MPVQCPGCGRKHDVTEFEGDRKIRCVCGRELDVLGLETVEDFLRFFESEDERVKALEIQSDAEEICRMILDDRFEDVDIQIAQDKLREKAAGFFPDKMETYRMIYEARFLRLREQFRKPGEGFCG
ncbi:MAG: hypothetical protein FGM27_00160 [Candidatus Omnitrophica bacterium]|nr:hypothetical protein [Candidatus Omnitrophota bacterium]